ncbi:DUF4349 domain-containing protein [Streptomyces lincolnensis]|uniref:DUF4349 domain-containing protein n=1 Tax=Streptomyces lincolnensis TaxID=1915 RepID=UPI001E35DF85|nr:DUF4349 domain-containing protein [Streptomyces lincolnensis]MCD7442942.1 DUF4349 domain-containing protein [Streptomyces lincolnensis]
MRARRSARHSARSSVRPVQALAGVLLAGTLALAGCSGGGAADTTSGDDGGGNAAVQEGGEKAGAAASDSGASGAKASAPPRLTASHIIRTASLTVRVEDVPTALDKARTTVENAGGYVGNETTTRAEEGGEQTEVVLRVPVDKYDEVLADLEGTGTLLDRTAKAQDVSDQVVDVESRITSQRASVTRIRELMDRATRLSDVVTLEGELSSRQAELESLLARQESLKDRTTLATITLSLHEPAHEAVAKDDDPGIVDALAGGWDAFVTMLRWIVVVLAAVLPFAAVLALLLLVWLRLLRPRLPRRPAPAGASTALGPLPVARPAPEPARSQQQEGDEEN